jgi:hypothetical protein
MNVTEEEAEAFISDHAVDPSPVSNVQSLSNINIIRRGNSLQARSEAIYSLPQVAVTASGQALAINYILLTVQMSNFVVITGNTGFVHSTRTHTDQGCETQDQKNYLVHRLLTYHTSFQMSHRLESRQDNICFQLRNKLSNDIRPIPVLKSTLVTTCATFLNITIAHTCHKVYVSVSNDSRSNQRLLP